MAATFTIHFTGDATQLVKRAKQVAAQNDLQFDGNEHSGNFSGNGVAATYTVAGDTVTITITRKPFFITMAVIQEHVQQFFAA